MRDKKSNHKTRLMVFSSLVCIIMLLEVLYAESLEEIKLIGIENG